MKKLKGSKETPKEKPIGVFLNRKKLVIEPDSVVQHADGTFRIEAVVDMQSIVASDLETGRIAILMISDLTSVIDVPDAVVSVSGQDLAEVEDKDWATALYRYHIIKPFLAENVPKTEVISVAKKNEIHHITLYRWITRYKVS